ncbi:MAG: lectin like domain-containing protein, partial [Endomicrobiales bacterium]
MKGLTITTVGGANGVTVPAVGGGNYPTSYDLRTLGKLTPVKDQGQFNTCWSFATYGSLESCLLPVQTYDFSEKNLVNLSGFDLGEPGGGNFFFSTAYLTRWGGPVNESDDSYPTGSSWTASNPGLPVQKHVQEVLFIPDRSSATDNDNVKEMVTDYGAVMTSMYMEDNDNTYLSVNDQNYYYYGSTSTVSNHAVAIVGWDDNYASTNFTSTPPGNGAFICRNSWGTLWGDSGYFYVSYYDANIATDMAVFDDAESTGNYYNIYQYDPLGMTTSLGYGGSTGWFANIFTAGSNEKLQAVSFYTAVVNSSYTINVYNHFNGTSFTGLLGSITGTAPIAGFHTIQLNSSISLPSNQNFCIIVELTTPGNNFPIPLEYPFADYSSQATASAGESYISSDGNSWTDITQQYPNTNVCVKAYTLNAAAPQETVTSITPNNGANNGLISITNIAGTGFMPGSTISLSRQGQSSINASDVSVVSSTQITCAFDLTGQSPGAWNVIVSTGGVGSLSAQLSNGFLIVSSITINSILPTSAFNSSPVSITNLSGSGFGAGTQAMLKKTGQSTIVATNVSIVNTTQLTCTFNLTGSSTGYWDVVVSTGGPGSTSATLTSGFLLNPMTVTSITPGNAFNTGPVSITNLSGTGFVTGSSVSLNRPGQTITASNVSVVSSSQITCAFDLTGQTPGAWNVVVSTGGSGSMWAQLSNGFIIVSSITISSILPASGFNSSPVSITNLSGSGFVTGTQVMLKQAGQPSIVATNVSVISPTQLSCTLNLAGSATGYWDVMVSTGATSSTLIGGFLINPMIINSVTPGSACNTGPVSITNLSGAGFVTGSSVMLTELGQNPINASNVSVVSSTQIICSFNLTGQAPGAWNIVVSTGGAGSVLAQLNNGF